MSTRLERAKSKARIKDIAFKANARTNDLTLKNKAKAKEYLSIKAKVMAKNYNLVQTDNQGLRPRTTSMVGVAAGQNESEVGL